MIYFDKDIKMNEAMKAARLLDCYLQGDGKGNVIIRPLSKRGEPVRCQHRNNVTPIRQQPPEPSHWTPGAA